jgi:hypothetical protein
MGVGRLAGPFNVAAAEAGVRVAAGIDHIDTRAEAHDFSVVGS